MILPATVALLGHHQGSNGHRRRISRDPASRYRRLMNDDYALGRFVAAQDPVYERVWGELCVGHKQTHWMWFIFPQLSGLGTSDMARRYAIVSIEEARAFLAHPILGERLCECTGQVLKLANFTIAEVFGFPDDLKFHSSMTLFREASLGGVFQGALDRYFDGAPDQRTLSLLSAAL